MTQKENQFLLKYLCMVLPYGVIVVTPKGNGHLCSINQTIFGNEYGINIKATQRNYFNDRECDIKPYLRPMSSMTEEEKELLKKEHVKDEKLYLDAINGDGSMRGKVILHYAADWCNKNHFDFMGLIPKNLAIKVTESNNPYED